MINNCTKLRLFVVIYKSTILMPSAIAYDGSKGEQKKPH